MGANGHNGTSERLGWREAFVDRLKHGDPVGAADALVALAPARRMGSGVIGVHTAAAAELLTVASRSPLVRRDWVERLLAQRGSTHKSLGAALLPSLWPAERGVVARRLQQLAEDDDWVTREDAAGVLGALLDRDFERALPIARQWVASGSPRLRRAALVAAKLAARSRRPERGEPLLALVGPALPDGDRYVRRNLGRFVIGDGLLRAYPSLTLRRLETAVGDQSATTRWNVAMAFSAAEGAHHVREAVPILRSLAADDRRLVWRAVAASMRNLARRQPEAIRGELDRWLRDRQRRHVAETVLGLAPSLRV